MNVFDEANERLMPLVERPKRVNCIFPEHEDADRDASLYPNGYYCFACNRGLNALQYVAFMERMTIAELLDKLGFPKGRPPQESRFRKWHPDPVAVFEIVEAADDEDLDTFSREWAIAKMLARYPFDHAPTSIFGLVTEQPFLDFCRSNGLNAVAIFDNAVLIRDVEEARP